MIWWLALGCPSGTPDLAKDAWAPPAAEPIVWPRPAAPLRHDGVPASAVIRVASEGARIAPPGPAAAWEAKGGVALERSDAAAAARDRELAQVLALPQMATLDILASAVGEVHQAALRAGAVDVASRMLDRQLLLEDLGSDGVVPADVVREQACALVPVHEACTLPPPVGCVATDRLSYLAELACADPEHRFSWARELKSPTVRLPVTSPLHWTRPD